MSKTRVPMSPTFAKAKPEPVIPSVCPSRRTPADVVTINMVLAIPAFGVTVGGLKLHVMPVRSGQENVTGSANPPADVTVMLNKADWPAVTVAVGGAAPSEKSLLAIVVVTGADVLPPKLPSPE